MSQNEQLEPFGEAGDLARLLRTERDAGEPDRATRDRMWARLAGALMVAPTPRSLGAGKILLAAAAVGALATYGLWHARTQAAPVAAQLAPPAVAATATSPVAPASAAPSAIPAPAAPAPTLGELAQAEREPRRPARRPVDTLGEEQRLVDQAREALAHGRPRVATAALDEHARRFAHGQLAEERESLAIRAEITLGRHDVARARADAFLHQHPDSLFAPVVRALATRIAVSAPDEP